MSLPAEPASERKQGVSAVTRGTADEFDHTLVVLRYLHPVTAPLPPGTELVKMDKRPGAAAP